jgi:hypothetical protein
VLDETDDTVTLEGVTRLRPGQLVEITNGDRESPHIARRVGLVLTWSVVRLGREGTTYRGVCRWQESLGQRLPGASPVALD